MRLLQQARCPRCASGLPLAVLWDFARHSPYDLVARSGALRGKIGITCPKCGARLRVLQTWVRVLFVALNCVVVGLGIGVAAIYARNNHFARNPWGLILGLATVSVALRLIQRRASPYLAQVRLLHDGEEVGFPLSSAHDGPVDPLLDPASSASNPRLERP
jgi:hypothetical protein